jgi:hypothetical protein
MFLSTRVTIPPVPRPLLGSFYSHRGTIAISKVETRAVSRRVRIERQLVAASVIMPFYIA